MHESLTETTLHMSVAVGDNCSVVSYLLYWPDHVDPAIMIFRSSRFTPYGGDGASVEAWSKHCSNDLSSTNHRTVGSMGCGLVLERCRI